MTVWCRVGELGRWRRSHEIELAKAATVGKLFT